MNVFERRVAVAVVLGSFIVACAGGDPSSPMSPSAPRWQLSGTVTRSAGDPISGATLEVIDGPNTGQRSTTDASGRYSFPALE